MFLGVFILVEFWVFSLSVDFWFSLLSAMAWLIACVVSKYFVMNFSLVFSMLSYTPGSMRKIEPTMTVKEPRMVAPFALFDPASCPLVFWISVFAWIARITPAAPSRTAMGAKKMVAPRRTDSVLSMIAILAKKEDWLLLIALMARWFSFAFGGDRSSLSSLPIS